MNELPIENIEEVKNSINQCLIDFCTTERKNILFEKNSRKNISKAFRGIGDFGEELTSYIFPDSFGSASKGGCAFDNIEIDYVTYKPIVAREVKTCCQIQPKICKNCENKIPYFQACCVFCNSTEFKEVKDSRFGIDSTAHFKYADILIEYILIIVGYDSITENISIKIYKIKSNNEYFITYLKNQKDNSKSPTCNLLPYSFDFYASGPILLLDYDIDIHYTIIQQYYNLGNDISIDFNTNKLSRQEKQQCGGLLDDSPAFVQYLQIKDILKLRNKKLNKPRGETTRL